MHHYAMIRAHISTSELIYLGILSDAERAGNGWERSGVRGWLTVHVIRATARARASDACAPSLVRRGLSDVLIAQELPCTRRLYRVTALGAAVIDDLLGRPHRRVATPSSPTRSDQTRFALPIDAWTAILGLRWAALTVNLPRYREAGWYRTTEIRAAYPSDRGWAPFTTSDLQWLCGHGLAEQRHVSIPMRPRNPVLEWRLSTVGERVRVVEEPWAPPHFDPRSVPLDAELLDPPASLDLAAEIELTQQRRRARTAGPSPVAGTAFTAIAPQLGFLHEVVS